MSAVLLFIAAMANRAWTRAYTLGLAGETGRSRREQVASDMWEQLHDATDANAVAFSIVGRLLRGVADDVTWRLFVAPRQDRRPLKPEGGPVVTMRSKLPFLITASLLGWLTAFALAITPLPHSLSWAGAVLLVIALTMWLVEARESGNDVTASVWPLAVATGITAVAAGTAFGAGRLGLVLGAPMAISFTTATVRVAAARVNPPQTYSAVVSAEVLQRRALAGDAIVVERMPDRRLSRRTVLQGSVWLGIGGVLVMTGGVIADFLWQRNVAGFGGIVSAGEVSKFPPGSKTKITAGKFWLVHLTPEQGGPGFLALWQKCPHLGCTVPWEPNFAFTDAASAQTRRGWFRCPCHQSTYNDAGVRVFGPAPRSMDRMAVTITPDGMVEVNTSAIEKGNEDNATYAIRALEV